MSDYTTYATRLIRDSRMYSHSTYERACWVADKFVERFPELKGFKSRIYNWAAATISSKAILPFPVE